MCLDHELKHQPDAIYIYTGKCGHWLDLGEVPTPQASTLSRPAFSGFSMVTRREQSLLVKMPVSAIGLTWQATLISVLKLQSIVYKWLSINPTRSVLDIAGNAADADWPDGTSGRVGCSGIDIGRPLPSMSTASHAPMTTQVLP